MVYKKKNTKRVYKKKSRSAPGMNVHSGNLNSPLATKLRSKMIYTSDVAISLVSNVTNPGVYTFSLNGLFDPDLTGVGHQPRGFDQLMSFYDHYVCIGANVRIDFCNVSSANQALCFASIRDTSVKSTNITDYTESKNTKWCILASESGGQSTKSMTMTINPNKFLGRASPLSDPQLKGSNISNPNEGASLHIGAVCTDYFTQSAVHIVVTIEYDTIFIEPKQPAQS